MHQFNPDASDLAVQLRSVEMSSLLPVTSKATERLSSRNSWIKAGRHLLASIPKEKSRFRVISVICVQIQTIHLVSTSITVLTAIARMLVHSFKEKKESLTLNWILCQTAHSIYVILSQSHFSRSYLPINHSTRSLAVLASSRRTNFRKRSARRTNSKRRSASHAPLSSVLQSFSAQWSKIKYHAQKTNFPNVQSPFHELEFWRFELL